MNMSPKIISNTTKPVLRVCGRVLSINDNGTIVTIIDPSHHKPELSQDSGTPRRPGDLPHMFSDKREDTKVLQYQNKPWRMCLAAGPKERNGAQWRNLRPGRVYEFEITPRFRITDMTLGLDG